MSPKRISSVKWSHTSRMAYGVGLPVVVGLLGVDGLVGKDGQSDERNPVVDGLLFAVESTVGDEQTDFRMAQYKSC